MQSTKRMFLAILLHTMPAHATIPLENTKQILCSIQKLNLHGIVIKNEASNNITLKLQYLWHANQKLQEHIITLNKKSNFWWHEIDFFPYKHNELNNAPGYIASIQLLQQDKYALTLSRDQNDYCLTISNK